MAPCKTHTGFNYTMERMCWTSTHNSYTQPLLRAETLFSTEFSILLPLVRQKRFLFKPNPVLATTYSRLIIAERELFFGLSSNSTRRCLRRFLRGQFYPTERGHTD